MKIRFPLFALALAIAAPAMAEQPAATVSAVEAKRFVVMDGGRNFRDVGGYRTADGRRVKRHVLYRSGSLGKLTEAGQRRLASLHITKIIDLRTTQERATDTFDIRTTYADRYWTRDYDHSRGDARSAFPDMSKMTADGMRAMMIGAYRTLPREQAASYRELFATLQQRRGKTVVNCTAGKDRTGIATALVLTALGVPYETVRQDFLLTNGAPGMNTLQGDISPAFASLPADVVAPVVGVDGVYLDTAFAQIRQDYGSVEAYLNTELGVGPQQISALRARMLKR